MSVKPSLTFQPVASLGSGTFSFGVTCARRSLLRRFAIGIVTLLCLSYTGHGEVHEPIATNAPAPLTIRMFDFAGLDADVIETASREASAIFKRAEVLTAWTQCHTNHPASQAPPCDPTDDPTVLAIRILAAPLEVEIPHRHLIFGFAFSPGRNGFASMASVFWSRVRELAAPRNLNPGRLLAAVLVHESGHLLLGENSHHPTGVMKAVWDEAEVTRIGQGSLSFWSGQGPALRKAIEGRGHVARRMAVQLASASPR